MSQYRHYIEIHLAVLLFGGAGLFGKLLSLSSGSIVLGRAFFGAVFIFLLNLFLSWLENRKKAPLDIIIDQSFISKTLLLQQFKPSSNKDLYLFVLMGGILAFHWNAFFESIQCASVSIGVLTFSTFPIFTILLASWFNKEKFILSDLFLALVAFGGIALILPSFDFNTPSFQGILWGIASGFSFAFLTIMNKRMVINYSSNCISFYQNWIAALILIPFFGREVLFANIRDWYGLILLGILFTGIAHTLFINSLNGLKAQTTSLIANLEPVYGIFLAWFFLGEKIHFRIIIGGSIILLVAFYATQKR